MKDSYERYTTQVFKKLDLDPKQHPSMADLLIPGIRGGRSKQRPVDETVEQLRPCVEKFKADK
jgi:hypothetical protein